MKFVIYRIFAVIILIISIPFLVIVYVLVKYSSDGPFIFKQKRLGKNKRSFYIYKIRTMVNDAEKLKKSYERLNEADGPVFKIYNDPRYTGIGKLLAHTGLDELPQLINIVKGEMSFVGPRPLPVHEAKKVSKTYDSRFNVLPGITSWWFVYGAHKLSFSKWMDLDVRYASNPDIQTDMKILLSTIGIFFHIVGTKILRRNI